MSNPRHPEEFKILEPNKIGGTDITCIRTYEGLLFWLWCLI